MLCGVGGKGGAVWGRWGGRGCVEQVRREGERRCCVVLVGREGLCGAGEEERGRENFM